MSRAPSYNKYKNLLKSLKNNALTISTISFKHPQVFEDLRDFDADLYRFMITLRANKYEINRKFFKYDLLAFLYLLEFKSFTSKVFFDWTSRYSEYPHAPKINTLYLSELCKREYLKVNEIGVYTRGPRFPISYNFCARQQNAEMYIPRSKKVRIYSCRDSNYIKLLQPV